MKHLRLIRIVSLVFCAILIAVIGYSWGRIANKQSPTFEGASQQALIPVSEDAFGAPFSLTNHLGETVTEKTFAGKYRLIYFGFTYCPAICPTELQKITMALKALPPEQAAKIQPLFITIDPERDTVEKMKNYVSMFYPTLVGITGSPEDIAMTLKAYKIYAAKVQDPQMSDYTMDHSSFIYFIGPKDNLLHIFKMDDKADMMAQTIARWLEHDSP